jgi:hypothetical protein
MGLLSFIYWLLTGPRPARRQMTDRTVREPTRGKIGKEWFAAASLHSELQLVRSRVSKDREK